LGEFSRKDAASELSIHGTQRGFPQAASFIERFFSSFADVQSSLEAGKDTFNTIKIGLYFQV
jgi:hypothetical protein